MLEMYDNRQRAELQKADQEKAKALITKIFQSLEMFYTLVDDKLTMKDVQTYMYLFESYFGELSPLVKYDSVLAEEKNARIAELRKLNMENQELKMKLGAAASLDAKAISAALRYYDSVFTTWYESCGFKYASKEVIYHWGILYELSPEVCAEPSTNLIGSSFSDLFNRLLEEHPALFGADCNWDIQWDRFQGEVLDTDNNRLLFTELLRKYFPGSRIQGFRSRQNDFGSLSLRVEVLVPFEDIAELMTKFN